MSRAFSIGKRAFFALKGPDAARYANGQVSQDVKLLTPEAALPACVTDAKGRLQALVYLYSREDGSIWIEAPAELEEELEPRLGRYLISDDAELENVSAEWELWHVLDAAEAPAGDFVRRVNRFGSEGYDVWLKAGEACGIPSIAVEEVEARRIAAKVPAWGKELTPGMLPPEAGLDRDAISYRKGCYIGQEVLSRIKSAGKLNRKLSGFLLEAGIAEGERFVTGEGKEAGVITSVSSVADAETGLVPALGYVEKAGYGMEEFSVGGRVVRVHP
ncbi:folate-binding protein YgfZ [Haloferula sp. BvORR071]|uniref:CAF17-like 4Fe-4S cluster assembly/insertion protein YgfZ n=1 Tax=Haloferula sp. BvORR071 TaxID=1396141 RepID=UPI0006982B25|nr:folate-binding protein YgfZ [Haloferula sp. BvORR071]